MTTATLTKKQIKKPIILTLVFITAVAGGLYYYQRKRFQHFDIHDSGMVYRSAWLAPDAISELIEEHQFRSVVNLCKPGEMGEPRWEGERQAVRNAGATLFEVSLPAKLDMDHLGIEEHLEILSDPENYPMLVHCQHGVTRTAKFLSMYDVLYRGMSAEESLSAQPLYGRDDHNVHVRAFVKMFAEKHEKLAPQLSAGDLDILRR
jgi:protein tyrosine phosphatase (PTP) superfamily phosphohydrolase (DUF442 family)